MRYPVVIHKDAGSAYGVTIPDLPGVFTVGDTIAEALANVQDAVEVGFHGEDEVPAPRTIDEHVANPLYEGGVFAYVDVDLSRLRGAAVRVNITLPQRDLDVIDRAAQAAGSNRSNFLREAGLTMARTMGPLRIAEPDPAPYGATGPKKAQALTQALPCSASVSATLSRK